LFKSVDDELLSQVLGKFPRGLRMDVQDRMAAIDEPLETGAGCFASHFGGGVHPVL
jgi:hypothetical protein